MPKAKKQWKKAAADVKFHKQYRDIERKPDHQLFTTDIDYKQINLARLTLREKLERKKNREVKHSKTEKLLVKRKMASLKNQKQIGKQNKDSEDVWGDEGFSVAKKKKKYLDYAKQQESLVPVILKPHPGQSYNPEATEHQELLKEVAERRVKEIEKEEQLKRRVRPSLETQLLKEEIEEIGESRIIAPEENTEEDKSGEESDEEDEQGEEKKRNIAKQTRWKSKKKRVIKTMRKIQESEAKQKRADEKILKQAGAIPSMLGQLAKQKKEETKKEQARLEQKKVEEQMQREGKLVRAKRLGRHAYKTPVPDYQLSEQLPDSLRKIQPPSSSVLKDRVDSLMSRGKIEVPWDAETLKRSEHKKGKLRQRMRMKTYERSTGIQRFFESEKPKENKKKGIFY